jgi:hypothetical protein
MKEEGKDHVVTGFKIPSDGWHIVEFQQGIDFLPGKGGEGIYTNERGFKTYKLPAKVKDDTDPDNEADCSQLVGMEKGGPWMANILACVGLWEAVKKKYPGPDVSVFDQPIIDGIKAKLPGMTCMMRTELDKDGHARTREMASFAKYKEILAEQKTKAASAKSGKGATKPATEAPPAETKSEGDGW